LLSEGRHDTCVRKKRKQSSTPSYTCHLSHGVEWSDSCTSRLCFGEKALGTLWIGYRRHCMMSVLLPQGTAVWENIRHSPLSDR
jgi:hypothetical protein